MISKPQSTISSLLVKTRYYPFDNRSTDSPVFVFKLCINRWLECLSPFDKQYARPYQRNNNQRLWKTNLRRKQAGHRACKRIERPFWASWIPGKTLQTSLQRQSHFWLLLSSTTGILATFCLEASLACALLIRQPEPCGKLIPNIWMKHWALQAERRQRSLLFKG